MFNLAYIALEATQGHDADYAANAVAATHGATVKDAFSIAEVSGFVANMSAESALTMQADPRVTLVEENKKLVILGKRLPPIVNPPPVPWGLDRIDDRPKLLNELYRLPPGVNGLGTDVYMADGGVRTTHADFGGRAYAGF